MIRIKLNDGTHADTYLYDYEQAVTVRKSGADFQIGGNTDNLAGIYDPMDEQDRIPVSPRRSIAQSQVASFEEMDR